MLDGTYWLPFYVIIQLEATISSGPLANGVAQRPYLAHHRAHVLEQ